MVERIEALAAVVRAHAGLELLPFSAESLLTARGGTIHWISKEEAFNMGHGCNFEFDLQTPKQTSEQPMEPWEDWDLLINILRNEINIGICVNLKLSAKGFIKDGVLLVFCEDELTTILTNNVAHKIRWYASLINGAPMQIKIIQVDKIPEMRKPKEEPWHFDLFIAAWRHPAEQRMFLARALGHLLLHISKDGNLRPNINSCRDLISPEEVDEADEFASFFLMPRAKMVETCHKNKRNYHGQINKDNLAAKFGVTVEAFHRHCRRLGLFG